MNLYLHELKEKPSIDFIYDYKHEIESSVDILAIQPAKIHLDFSFKSDELHASLTVDVLMDLACSKTLKPVGYHMQFSDLIIFGSSEDADYALTDPIPLTEIIYGYIVSEKPYTIYHPDAQEVDFEKEKSPHPAFAELDKTLKK